MVTEKLINEIALEVGISKADAGHVLQVMIDTIIESIAHGEQVELSGFGNFFARPLTAYAQENTNTNNTNINALAIQQSAALKASINLNSQ